MDFIILFCIKQLIIISEEGILNYSPTVMFRGTPFMYIVYCYLFRSTERSLRIQVCIIKLVGWDWFRMSFWLKMGGMIMVWMSI